MARISYVEQENAPAIVADLFSTMKARSGKEPMNIFKIVGHAPTALPPLAKLSIAMLAKGRLDPRLREMAIIRVSTLIDCDYERGPHTMLGLAMGMTERQVAEIENWSNSDAFDGVDKAVLRLTDEETQTARITDATFAEVAKYLDEGQLVELVMVVGFYGFIGRILLGFEVDLESQELSKPADILGRPVSPS